MTEKTHVLDGFQNRYIEKYVSQIIAKAAPPEEGLGALSVLPKDILLHQLMVRFSPADFAVLSRVNRTFLQLTETPLLWQRLVEGLLQAEDHKRIDDLSWKATFYLLTNRRWGIDPKLIDSTSISITNNGRTAWNSHSGWRSAGLAVPHSSTGVFTFRFKLTDPPSVKFYGEVMFGLISTASPSLPQCFSNSWYPGNGNRGNGKNPNQSIAWWPNFASGDFVTVEIDKRSQTVTFVKIVEGKEKDKYTESFSDWTGEVVVIFCALRDSAIEILL